MEKLKRGVATSALLAYSESCEACSDSSDLQKGAAMDVFENAPEQALAWHEAGRGAVLATVVNTWGSAPRRVGAQLVISGDGEMQGSVSGGCVEGAVVLEAADALSSGTQRLLEYGVSDGDAFAVGLACGGTIRILVEPVGSAMPIELLRDLVAARASRMPVAYEVNVKTGARRLAHDGYEKRFAMDRSGFEENEETFVAIHNPPLRLLVVGAVHIAQALVPMARIAGYDPIIIDPRGAFGSDARFPGETIVSDWPDEALEQTGLDARTALVLLTHDPKLDDPALHIALRSRAFYIGALGSKRTHAARVERLAAAGFQPNEIGRIHAPIGLDIGASGPPEIAVSIIAQMTQILRQGQ
jgi:xanthine dehydrogenase accessory factor